MRLQSARKDDPTNEEMQSTNEELQSLNESSYVSGEHQLK